MEIIDPETNERKGLACDFLSLTLADVVWQWLSDNGWEALNYFQARRLEEAQLHGTPTIPGDEERYFDLEQLLQVRNDDPSRSRPIRRKTQAKCKHTHAHMRVLTRVHVEH
jgi:hypothetical protein